MGWDGFLSPWATRLLVIWVPLSVSAFHFLSLLFFALEAMNLTCDLYFDNLMRIF